jgi:hypothetical protein
MPVDAVKMLSRSKEHADLVKNGQLEGCNSRKMGFTSTKWRLNQQGQEFSSQKMEI